MDSVPSVFISALRFSSVQCNEACCRYGNKNNLYPLATEWSQEVEHSEQTELDYNLRQNLDMKFYLSIA